MTLVARPIPPTPPQSTDGHSLPEEFGGPGVYRPAYDNMAMSDEEISTRQQEMVSLLSSDCCCLIASANPSQHYGSPPFYNVPVFSQNMPPQSVSLTPMVVI